MKHILSLTIAGLVVTTSSAFAGHCNSTCKQSAGSSRGLTQNHSGHVVHYTAVNRPADIVDTAINSGSFKTLVSAVEAAGLVGTLKGKGPFTVFAPTDEAFAKLPESTLASLLRPENKGRLQAILTYHVVPGVVKAADVVKLASAETVQGQSVKIAVEGGRVQIDNANVVKTDIHCSNGVIHVIDSVILPEESAAAEHDGRSLAIDGVGSFKTIFAAIEAAGLTETLTANKPFTVFAPTDEAFANLPEGTVESLLQPENREKLRAILTYHVLPGKLTAADVVKLRAATTVNGEDVRIDLENGGVQVSGANVLKTDIDCAVGVLHAIDKVLIP